MTHRYLSQAGGWSSGTLSSSLEALYGITPFIPNGDNLTDNLKQLGNFLAGANNNTVRGHGTLSFFFAFSCILYVSHEP
jgi:hypothetical protein